MDIQHIAFADLRPSASNVRRVKTSVDSLAFSIGQRGLISPLAVLAIEDGKFEVLAGGRRFRAIAKCIKDKTWPKDQAVPCNVISSDQITEISYEENAERMAMHPADAIRSFATLSAEGKDETEIANNLGYDVVTVRRYLALATLSPKVINALATDKIDVATARAFTLSDDHKVQERVLKTASTAHHVRQLLTSEKMRTTDKHFLFISEEYAAREGTITHDLFDKDGDGYANNVELVQDLVEAKFEQLADEALAEGWGDVVTAAHTPYESYNWDRIHGSAEPSAELKAKSRLLILLETDGTVKRTPYHKGRAGAKSTSGAPVVRPAYSDAMVEDLTTAKTHALQLEVSRNHHAAQAVLLDALLPILFSRFPTGHAVQLSRGATIHRTDAEAVPGNLIEIASVFNDPEVATIIATMPDGSAKRFDWILSLESQQVSRLLDACSGALIDAKESKFSDGARVRSANRIANVVNLDMRNYWEGGIAFYDRVTSATLKIAMTEACGAEAADNCAKMKKGALAAACAERIAGRGWLPAPLIIPAPETLVELDDDSGDDTDDEATGDEGSDGEFGDDSDDEERDDRLAA
jgi:ParB family chromosome partitioning protein